MLVLWLHRVKRNAIHFEEKYCPSLSNITIQMGFRGLILKGLILNILSLENFLTAIQDQVSI